MDLSIVRTAIHDEHKLRIEYSDEQGRISTRIIWPFALAYYLEATLIGAWCELRSDFRHFRADRVGALTVLDEGFPVPGRALAADWQKRMSPGGWLMAS